MDTTDSVLHQAVHLKDYTPPPFAVESVEMVVELFENESFVNSTLVLKKCDSQEGPLELDGEGLELLEITLDGKEVPASDYQLSSKKLVMGPQGLSDEFTLHTRVRITPQNNHSLKGLYKSGDVFCTQCEAEGFRCITYYLDRPDVLSKFQVRIEADQQKYPYLLANGNLIDQGTLEGNRHFRVWQDPFRKPCYLFALVAGDFGIVQQTYQTVSGRTVALEIYSDKGCEQRCLHAMESLKKAMKWDEEQFGLEYDLDTYMIVAVNSFNFGAMENKGLNIFNSSLVLADPLSATDDDFKRIESVVAHEYFHNWTGNRVTCRDWFQLTLKEGLTVYRDQEFSSDMQSRAVERIEMVRSLKEFQFPEDSGPMAHPIRPQSYVAIDNFYTSTVYQKGAEVIRMVASLIGKENFRRGMDKYFELYDGQAVTTEDFLHAMEKASGHDLRQFAQTWYNQMGTPEIRVELIAEGDGVDMSITQTTPTQKKNRPFYLPFPVALYSKEGKLLEERKLILSSESESFHFSGVGHDVIPSVNLGFASPVKISYDYTESDLMLLMMADRDEHNRFEACQELAMIQLLRIKDEITQGKGPVVSEDYFKIYGRLLSDDKIHKSLKAYSLTLPGLGEIIERQSVVDFENTEKARRFLVCQLGVRFFYQLKELYLNLQSDAGDDEKMAETRLLKNTVLSLMAQGVEGQEEESEQRKEVLSLMAQQYHQAQNMTDQMEVLSAIVHFDHEERERIVSDFYEKWKGDSTVYSKWLRAVASGRFPGNLDSIKALMEGPCFDVKVPNHVRSVFAGLVSNALLFHDSQGTGYRFLADFIKDYDAVNPMVASLLLGRFLCLKYPVMDGERKAMVKDILEGLRGGREGQGLSENVSEVVEKTLSEPS